MVEPVVLKTCHLVAGLGESQIAQIAALGTARTYNSGQSVVVTGESADELFVVLSGTVVVTTDDGDLLGEIGPDSVVGEIGLVDARPRTANATCNGPVTMVVFSNQEFRKLLSDNRDWGFVVLANICRILATRLRRVNSRLDDLADQAEVPWGNAVG